MSAEGKQVAYQFIISSQLTNLLQVINYTDKFRLHPIDKTLNFEENNDKYSLSLKIPKACKLRPSVVNLLSLILIRYTKNPEASFDITLTKYMDFTGLKTRNRALTEADKILKINEPKEFAKKDLESRKKEARKIITADMDTLSKIKIKYKNKYASVNSELFSNISKERRGNITGEFHPEFLKYLAKNKKHLMIYPDSIARTNSSRMNNPYLFAVKNKINQLCKLNMYDTLQGVKKKFFDIKIETLLKVCYLNGMSSPEELYKKYLDSGKKQKPHYTRDIKDIFDKTIECIEAEENEYYSIEYITDKKTEMYAEEDIESGQFFKWQQGFIRIIFKDSYPRADYDPEKIKRRKKKNE